MNHAHIRTATEIDAAALAQLRHLAEWHGAVTVSIDADEAGVDFVLELAEGRTHRASSAELTQVLAELSAEVAAYHVGICTSEDKDGIPPEYFCTCRDCHRIDEEQMPPTTACDGCGYRARVARDPECDIHLCADCRAVHRCGRSDADEANDLPF